MRMPWQKKKKWLNPLSGEIIGSEDLRRIEELIINNDVIVRRIQTTEIPSDDPNKYVIEVQPVPRHPTEVQVTPILVNQESETIVDLSAISGQKYPVPLARVRIPAGFWITGIKGAMK